MFGKIREATKRSKITSWHNTTITMLHCRHGVFMFLIVTEFSKQVLFVHSDNWRLCWCHRFLRFLAKWPRNSSSVPEICFQLLSVLTSSVPNLATWLRSFNDIWNSSILSSEGFNSFISSSFWIRPRRLSKLPNSYKRLWYMLFCTICIMYNHCTCQTLWT